MKNDFLKHLKTDVIATITSGSPIKVIYDENCNQKTVNATITSDSSK